MVANTRSVNKPVESVEKEFNYKILKPIEYLNQIGEPEGMLEVGSIQTVPESIGKKWVKEGSAEKIVESKKKSILKNTSGMEVPEGDYFYKATENGGVAPSSFTKMCGMPVDREDLVEIFDNIFNPGDNILFYKSINKEVYLIIIPLKYSTSVGPTHESVDGDFQKHAISFIGEGSVNEDTLKMKLKRILGFIDFDKR
jgi:hypothetical protein